MIAILSLPQAHASSYVSSDLPLLLYMWGQCEANIWIEFWTRGGFGSRLLHLIVLFAICECFLKSCPAQDSPLDQFTQFSYKFIVKWRPCLAQAHYPHQTFLCKSWNKIDPFWTLFRHWILWVFSQSALCTSAYARKVFFFEVETKHKTIKKNSK